MMVDAARFFLPVGWAEAALRGASDFGTPFPKPNPVDGSLICCLERGSDTAAGVWDPLTGALLHFRTETLDAAWTPDGRHLIELQAPGALVVSRLGWPTRLLEDSASLQFPVASLAGVDLLLSPAGRSGVVCVHSGQSEVGFALFSLPDLETLACQPVQAGECASPCVFSPDDRYLALVAEPYGAWWSGGDQSNGIEAPATGGPVHWATLLLQEARAGGRFLKQHILVDLPKGWEPDDELNGSTWPRNVHFRDSAHLEFDLPWGGQCTLDIPPTGDAFAPAPPGRQQ